MNLFLDESFKIKSYLQNCYFEQDYRFSKEVKQMIINLPMFDTFEYLLLMSAITLTGYSGTFSLLFICSSFLFIVYFLVCFKLSFTFEFV